MIFSINLDNFLEIQNNAYSQYNGRSKKIDQWICLKKSFTILIIQNRVKVLDGAVVRRSSDSNCTRWESNPHQPRHNHVLRPWATFDSYMRSKIGKYKNLPICQPTEEQLLEDPPKPLGVYRCPLSWGIILPSQINQMLVSLYCGSERSGHIHITYKRFVRRLIRQGSKSRNQIVWRHVILQMFGYIRRGHKMKGGCL